MIKIKRDKGAFAQGDCLFVACERDEIPADAHVSARGQLVVAHSETDHHHVIDAAEHEAQLFATANPMLCYLVCETMVELEHRRPWDAHEALQIPAGTYKILRQREGAPEGWRRVED